MDEKKLTSLFKKEGSEISDLGSTLDMSGLSKLIEIINTCKNNIFITGCGTSAMAAKKAVHTLRVVNKTTFYLNPSDAVHGALGTVHENDLVIIISKGGNTAELVSFLPNLKEKNTFIIAITENLNSKIAQASDFVFRVHVKKELDEFNMLATASTMAVISVFDVVAVVLMNLDHFSESQFLVNHPSGDVGERLKKDIKQA